MGPVVAEFFKRRLRHVQGPLAGRPIILEPWQRDDVDLIFEVDDDGRRVWNRVLWEQARGNGKTPVVGGISLRELGLRRDAPRVFAAAGARDQAGLLMEFARPQVEVIDGARTPLSDVMSPVTKWSIRCPATGGVMRVLSRQGDLAHGLSISFAGIDELHVFESEAQRELYAALATALKRPWSWEMSITTAGRRRSSLLGQRRDALLKRGDVWVSDDGCLTIARNREARTLLISRGLPREADPGDERLWRAVNPASWVEMSYLRSQAMSLPRGMFCRLHLNQWVEGEDTAINEALWMRCADEEGAVIPRGGDAWLAVAMSEKTDTGVLVAVGRPGDDGRRPVVFERVCGDAESGASVNHLAAAAVRAAADRWRVVSLAFNPLHFAREAAALGREGVPLFRHDAKSIKPGFREVDDFMCPASRDLLEDIAGRRLAHAGESWVTDQVTAARAVTRKGAWRLVRPPVTEAGDLDGADSEPDRAEAAFGLLVALAAARQPTGRGMVPEGYDTD